jgi:hypothetical protein
MRSWIKRGTGLAIVLYCLIPILVVARGGGGGHSSGGSSSGGSYGGGGSSGGVFFLGGGGGGGGFVTYVILFVMLLVLVFAIKSKIQSSGSFKASQYVPLAEGENDSNVGLEAIKANDPGFNEQAFLDRTQAAFFLLQKAWMDRNVDEGRAYMSPGLYQSWKAQVDEMVSQHKKNVLENLVIAGEHVVKALHDENFDSISVRIDASCTDYEVDDQTGKEIFAVGGKKADRPFTEYWTFQRSAGAKTLVTGGVTDKKCPNCGAPLDVNATGNCKYCGEVVTSGKFDWVLSKIDQANEWRG